MSIYMIDIPNCPLTMEAENMGAAIYQCTEIGLDPSLLREATPSEVEQHAAIQREVWGESPV